MLCRYWVWSSFLAIGCVLLAGCRVVTRHGPIPSREPSELASVTDSTVDRPAERIAQAHAHFAAGVIHDMNDETEAVLEEFYKAGLEDLENEGLILEVTRRLLQNKQQEKALELLTRATAQPKA